MKKWKDMNPQERHDWNMRQQTGKRKAGERGGKIGPKSTRLERYERMLASGLISQQEFDKWAK